MENIFAIFMIVRKKDQRETVPEGATKQDGASQGGKRAPDPRGLPVGRLLLFFGRNKANFQRKIWAKVSIQSELRISIYIRNGERAEGARRNRERQIQSRRGSRPSHAMEAKDRRGNPSLI